MKKIILAILLISTIIFWYSTHADSEESIEEIQSRWSLEYQEYDDLSYDEACKNLFWKEDDIEEIMSLFYMIDDLYIDSIN